ncbi:MAG: carbohydrate kinase family protein [Pseudothermotoga sp.]
MKIKIAVVGGIFWDVYIYGEKPHSAEILEVCGGSGLNIAYGLKLFGFDVSFFSNIGTDYRADLILSELKKLDFNTEYIKRIHGETGHHIALNEKPIAVNRGVNKIPLEIDEEDLRRFDYLVINTEVPPESVYRCIDLLKEKTIFLDIGPLANLKKDTKTLSENLLVIGNQKECERIDCDVIKLGPKGARWGELSVDGDGMDYPYKIGTGDVFDVVLISSLLRGVDRLQALEKAVSKAQMAAKTTKGAFSKMRTVCDEK